MNVIFLNDKFEIVPKEKATLAKIYAGGSILFVDMRKQYRAILPAPPRQAGAPPPKPG